MVSISLSHQQGMPRKGTTQAHLSLSEGAVLHSPCADAHADVTLVLWGDALFVYQDSMYPLDQWSGLKGFGGVSFFLLYYSKRNTANTNPDFSYVKDFT